MSPFVRIQLSVSLLALLLTAGVVRPGHAQDRPRLVNVKSYAEGLALIQKKPNHRWRVVDTTGKATAKIRLYPKHLKPFGNGLAPIHLKDGWGYINRDGELKLPPKYNLAGVFHEGRAWVVLNDDYNVIDTGGTILTDTDWRMVGDYYEGLARVYNDTAWGFLNRRGDVQIPLEYTTVRNFHEGLAAARMDSLWGYINSDGEWEIPPRYEHWVGNFRAGYAAVQFDSLFGYINRRGDTLIGPSYDDLGPFAEPHRAGAKSFPALAPVYRKADSGWGYIDTSGKWVVLPQYQRAQAFVGNRAAVLVGQKWGFIDRTGELVITPRFSEVQPFNQHNLALVQTFGRWGFINRSGALVVGD